jgi:hypothetical protein
VRVDEDEVLGALREDTIPDPADGHGDRRAPAGRAPGRMAETLLALLLAPNRTNYAFRLTTTIVSDSPSLNGSLFHVALDGTLGDLISARDHGGADPPRSPNAGHRITGRRMGA